MATDENINNRKRRFLLGATTAVGTVGVIAAAVPFAMSLWPSERAKAAGVPVEVDISKLEPGQKINVEWRGKVVWVIHRTPAMLAALPKLDSRVPTFRPEVAPPDLGSDWLGGFFCPCHQSKFDLAGRVYKGVPAPTNLIIPPYKFLSDTRILVGADGKSAPV